MVINIDVNPGDRLCLSLGLLTNLKLLFYPVLQLRRLHMTNNFSYPKCSQVVREESAPVFIEDDEEEDIESALAFAQKRREQMILPDFQFDDKGSLLSTGE